MKQIWILFLIVILVGSSVSSTNIERDDSMRIIEKLKEMPLDKLLEKGDTFRKESIDDSAFICYSLVYNSIIKSDDTASLKTVCMALNGASTIRFTHCDYKSSLDLLLRALKICDDIGYSEYVGRIYNNIGNIHYQFKDYKLAKKYYLLAYRNGMDDYVLGIATTNLGVLLYDEKKYDSALLLYRKAYKLKDGTKESAYHATLNNIAAIYQELHQYDSAFLYCKSALKNARKLNMNLNEAVSLLNIGQLYVETNNLDSATHYLKLSKVISEKSKLFNVLYSTYKYLSEIEEKKGDMRLSLEYYKKYSSIKDSIFDTSEYGKINELQFVYDMSKIDKRIKELNFEQIINENTIRVQRRFQIVMGVALFIVACALVILYRKNRLINEAYSALISKNIEIVNSDKSNYKFKLEYEEMLKERDLIIEEMALKLRNEDVVVNIEEINKHQNAPINDKHRRELELAILEIMNDSNVFCDPDFSLSKLSEMVGTNFTYISWIINNSFNKNFSTFINEYRIREACRMFASLEYKKYSIESVATMVGFKSKGSFNPIFKEIIGVTPSFYIKSSRG